MALDLSYVDVDLADFCVAVWVISSLRTAQPCFRRVILDMSLLDRPGGLHISCTRCPCGRKTKNNSTDSSPAGDACPATRNAHRSFSQSCLFGLMVKTKKNADVNTACSRAVEIRDRWLTERAHECLGTQYDDVSLLTLSSCKSCPSNRPLVL